jgi:hypothetical protein
MGINYNEPLLTIDPKYNISIGNAYLSGVLDGFSGSYVLSLAAYNAGPGRVRQWLREFGDPRDPGRDVVDWIEMIPFNETRGYVQRVLEGLQVYRLRMTPPPKPVAVPASASLTKPQPVLPSASAGWCLIACAPDAPPQAPGAPLVPTPVGLTGAPLPPEPEPARDAPAPAPPESGPAQSGPFTPEPFVPLSRDG